MSRKFRPSMMRFLISSSGIILLFMLISFAYGSIVTDVFTISCAPLTIQRSDPIIDPGVASSHAHIVAGGTAFQRTMADDTARNSNTTTCSIDIDKSNYWIPQLYHRMPDGQVELIECQGNVSSYFLRTTPPQELIYPSRSSIT